MENPIPIGVVGLNFGRWIIEELLTAPGKPYFKLAAMCDADPERLNTQKTKWAEHFQGKVTQQIDDLLNDPEIPVIGLFTGPVRRADFIRRIIRAGKDVITTKPFELDPEAAKSVLEEAQSLGRKVMMNSPGPVLSTDLALIKDWQKKHNLGPAVAARAEVTADYREKADGGWYDNPELCPVAPLFRLGIYMLNDIWPLFPDAEKLHVLHSRLFTGRPTPDHAQLGIRFRSGALVNIFASFCVGDGDHYRNSLVINFERGTVFRDSGPERKQDGHLVLITKNDKWERIVLEDVYLDAANLHHYPWQAFHQILTGNPPPNLTTHEQILAGVRIVRAMSEAERGSGWAEVR